MTFGLPYMIDLQDCDAHLPSSGDASLFYMDELVRLSVLMGRVQKTIYRCVAFKIGSLRFIDMTTQSPTGLAYTMDEDLQTLLGELGAWKENLPESLRFTGNESSQAAGMFVPSPLILY